MTKTKYKNLKLNPNKNIRNIVYLRCLPEDYEKINDIFNSIFVTARLFNYEINIFRSGFSNGCVYLNFEDESTYIQCKFFNTKYKIEGIDITKKIKSQIMWLVEQKFFHYNGDNKIKSQEEMLNEIFNFL